MKRESNAWIFVSHSVRDIERVRRIRNELEARGAEPLLFFLKTLEDSEELRELLRREIRARNFFLLCDSENARGSRWVREEQDYVRGLIGKRTATVDLASPWEEQVVKIDEFLKIATAYFSYALADKQQIEPWVHFLMDQDMAVWTAETDIAVGQNWMAAVGQAIVDAANNGYLIAFLSTRSLRSAFAAYEINLFQQIANSNGRLILVDLEPVDHLVPSTLQAIQRISFHVHNDNENRNLLLRALGLA